MFRSSSAFTGRKLSKGRILLFLILSSIVFSASAFGQRKADLGIMASVPWYLGDLSYQAPQLADIPVSIGFMLRHNFDMRSSLKAHSSYYRLGGAGDIYGGNAWNFNASFVDLGLDFEFNWWPYKTALRRTKWTPYVTAGLGYSLNFDGNSDSHLYMPVGGGVKFNIVKRLSAGAEFTMRKSFTDGIDGVWNLGLEDSQSAVGNNDWYMFTGIFITYKLFNFLSDCPTYNEQTYSGKRRRGKEPE